MKDTIDPIEQEINEIRLRIYEETKDMTPAQATEYYMKGAEAAAKKYGFRIVAGANAGNDISVPRH